MSLAKHIAETRTREIVTERVDGYQKNCSTGFNRAWFSQAHHIVCVSSIGKRKDDYPETPPDLADYLEACLWLTPWDINDGKNLIGLPTNWQYRDSDGQAPENLPSHQVDHNTRHGYTDEVSKYLKDNVWNALTAKKKVHDVDVAKLKDELEGASNEFRDRLAKRGAREKGTKFCWEHRFEQDYKDTWYYPFSMGQDPSPRSPGISLESLETIFRKIKLLF